MRIRPAAGNQLPMPAQHCSRPDEQRPPPRRSRQQSAERSQKRPIRRSQLRKSYLALQHAQLMTEQQDLDLLLPFGATAEHHQFQQPSQRPVKKRQNDTLRAARHGRRPSPVRRGTHSGNPIQGAAKFPAPTGLLACVPVLVHDDYLSLFPNARRLLAQKLSPGWSVAPRRGRQAGRQQKPPDDSQRDGRRLRKAASLHGEAAGGRLSVGK
jgi:hypothetical protein